jgi:hypothetical protein
MARLPDCRCPVCGHGPVAPPPRTAPRMKPGDPTVCPHCGCVLVLDARLVLRVPEPGALGTMLGEDLGFMDAEPARPARRASP